MFQESTLASIAFLIGDTLEQEYGISAEPILTELGIDASLREEEGARVLQDSSDALWLRALEESGDPAFPIRAGQRASLTDYYTLGHAWLASCTLRGALERMMRYDKVLNTAAEEKKFYKDGDQYIIWQTYADDVKEIMDIGVACGIAAGLKMCRISMGKPVYPTRVELMISADGIADAYKEVCQCPMEFSKGANVIWFNAADLEDPLPGSIPDVIDATDRISERYIESLDSSKVATEVRRHLVQMLPRGDADQDSVAGRMYRSASTLQRQLSAEGTNYRDLLESTRRVLAEDYLRDGHHSQAEIAYLIGFSDQSNFARAFKRWTGMSPGEFQKAA